MDINQNIAECMVSNNYFTGTVYTNICEGSSRFVPYGPMDYSLFIFIIGLILLIVGGFIIVARS